MDFHLCMTYLFTDWVIERYVSRWRWYTSAPTQFAVWLGCKCLVISVCVCVSRLQYWDIRIYLVNVLRLWSDARRLYLFTPSMLQMNSWVIFYWLIRLKYFIQHCIWVLDYFSWREMFRKFFFKEVESCLKAAQGRISVDVFVNPAHFKE